LKGKSPFSLAHNCEKQAPRVTPVEAVFLPRERPAQF
jgi:hypothetical protein